MSLSNYLENALLNHIRGTAYTVPAGLYVKLHTASGGEDGTLNAAAEATRKLVTFGAPSGGSMAGTGTPVASWTAVSTTENYSHFTVWDAITAGNCLGHGPLGATATMTAGDTYELTALTWALD